VVASSCRENYLVLLTVRKFYHAQPGGILNENKKQKKKPRLAPG